MAIREKDVPKIQFLSVKELTTGKFKKVISPHNFQVGRSSQNANLTVNGEIRGKQLWYSFHNSDLTANTKIYFFWGIGHSGGIAETTEQIAFNAPHDGTLLRLNVNCNSDPGSTIMAVHIDYSGTATYTETDTFDATGSRFEKEFVFSPVAMVTKGELLTVAMDPTNVPDETIITAVWEWDQNM